MAEPGAAGPPPPADPSSIPVPELRDYHQINAELEHRLQLGHRRIRLDGVEGQRLLLLRLRGPWRAVVELAGNAGPELAAEMDAPGLVVVCRGSAADGAGRGLAGGTLLILGNAGVALGYGQRGGRIVAAGVVGARAGLLQEGGDLVLLNGSGRLTGEAQSGGRILFRRDFAGPHVGHARRGGTVLDDSPRGTIGEGSAPDAAGLAHEARDLVARFTSTS
ncbi:GXGXG motif protein [Aquisphaera giovannonii]|uniref:GXGXG motif protein n=1 Tax=Aquisphaera giovannonii TaxID=406548 RepID=A0A5B9VYP6_9BACT|nr:glutamate synthase [Aquisphaera giovannonii]QEH33061.1 GXGXG motif protein [Aquisphaera giovannonii]